MVGMTDFRMTSEQRESFLADVHVGVLSVERSDGPPLAAPVWYRYQPGGDVELMTDGDSLKGRLLRAAGRASLCAQREALPYAYVTVEGPITFADAADGDLLDIATRYLGPDGGRAYAAGNAGGDSTIVRLTPERWFSTDYSGLDLG